PAYCFLSYPSRRGRLYFRPLCCLESGHLPVLPPFPTRRSSDLHTPFLWITARSLSAPPDGGDLIRVTTLAGAMGTADSRRRDAEDRKSTRLNSSHGSISYAVFCLKKKDEPSTKPRRSGWILRHY